MNGGMSIFHDNDQSGAFKFKYSPNALQPRQLILHHEVQQMDRAFIAAIFSNGVFLVLLSFVGRLTCRAVGRLFDYFDVLHPDGRMHVIFSLCY